MSVTIIGALAIVEVALAEAVQDRLRALAGVTPFPVDDPASTSATLSTRLGVLIEAPTLDDGYHLLRHNIETIEGVLAIWPVYAHFGTEINTRLTEQDPPSSSEFPRVPGNSRELEGTLRLGSGQARGNS